MSYADLGLIADCHIIGSVPQTRYCPFPAKRFSVASMVLDRVV